MIKYVSVIGEITSNTFRDYAEQVHVGPKTYEAFWRDGRRVLSDDVLETPAGVLISSPGGDIGYALAILDDIDYWKRTTLATGICQSAAAVLATAGEGKRICTMDTLFRFMPAQTELMEDPENPGNKIERVPDLRHYLQTMLVARMAARLKTPPIDAAIMFDGTFINSMRAKELDLVDEVISTENTPYGNSDRLSGSKKLLVKAGGFIDVDGDPARPI